MNNMHATLVQASIEHSFVMTSFVSQCKHLLEVQLTRGAIAAGYALLMMSVDQLTHSGVKLSSTTHDAAAC